ncbi:hypothetical protein ISCGN_002917 [Ixodes scapularis]
MSYGQQQPNAYYPPQPGFQAPPAGYYPPPMECREKKKATSELPQRKVSSVCGLCNFKPGPVSLNGLVQNYVRVRVRNALLCVHGLLRDAVVIFFFFLRMSVWV